MPTDQEIEEDQEIATNEAINSLKFESEGEAISTTNGTKWPGGELIRAEVWDITKVRHPQLI